MSTLPAMRLKTHWFKPGAPKTPEQQAGATGFVIWRVSIQMLKRMRGAQFDIEAGTAYFDFVREVLVFLVLVADRLAHQRFDAETRVLFTTALVKHVADTLQGNEEDLLGLRPADAVSAQDQFIDLFNELAGHYAEFDDDPNPVDPQSNASRRPPPEGVSQLGSGPSLTRTEFTPGFAFMRYLGHRLEATLPEKDRRWVIEQVMASEAPEAVALVQRTLRDLHNTEPRKMRHSSVGAD